MAYFSKDMLAFFAELRENNHKEWFDANRKRYETEVKAPFKSLVTDLLERLKELDPATQDEAKDAIFRINRDVRFSKDKSPYKTHLAAALSRPGKKADIPGFYLTFNDKMVQIGGGHYMPAKEHLMAIRQEIAYHMDEFDQLITDPAFVDQFGGLGDSPRNKTLPKDLKEAADSQPLIYNKGFWYMQELPAELALSDTLIEDLMPYFRAAAPLNSFLFRAIDTGE